MAPIKKIAETLRSEAFAGMKPKELLAAVRHKHPEITKKEFVRAAFYALIESHGMSAEHLNGLHAFAISERGLDEDADVKARKRHKKKHKAAPDATAAY